MIPRQFNRLLIPNSNAYNLPKLIEKVGNASKWLYVLDGDKLGINTELFLNQPRGNLYLKGSGVGFFQQVVKEICLFNQNYTDLFSNSPVNIFSGELHHAIITRNDVRGCKDEVKFLIHNPLNCIVVSRKSHQTHPKIQNRRYNAELLVNIYSESNIWALERFLSHFPTKTSFENYYSNLGGF
jgi:hypothetical protein